MDYRNSHIDKGFDYDEDLLNDSFAFYMMEAEKKYIRYLVSKLYRNKIHRYLDFACGTGRITQLVEPLADKSIGIDVSDKMLTEAKKKCKKTEFILQDITLNEIDIPPVDLITSFRFFGNAGDKLRIQVFDALSKITIQGSYIIINNHRNPWSINRLLLKLTGTKDDRDLNYFKLRKYLKNSGFKVEKNYGIGLWIFRVRLRHSSILNSRLARVLDLTSKIPLLHIFSPDMVIVARKVR